MLAVDSAPRGPSSRIKDLASKDSSKKAMSFDSPAVGVKKVVKKPPTTKISKTSSTSTGKRPRDSDAEVGTGGGGRVRVTAGEHSALQKKCAALEEKLVTEKSKSADARVALAKSEGQVAVLTAAAATASQLHAAQLASQISDLQSKQSAEIMKAMMAGHKLATDAAAGNPLRGA